MSITASFVTVLAQTAPEAIEAVEESTGFTVGEIAAWLLIGYLVGTTASAVYLRRPKGFGFFGNTAIGLLGAFSGAVTGVLNLEFDWGAIELGVDELIFSLIGAIGALALLSYLKNRGTTTPKPVAK